MSHLDYGSGLSYAKCLMCTAQSKVLLCEIGRNVLWNVSAILIAQWMLWFFVQAFCMEVVDGALITNLLSELQLAP